MGRAIACALAALATILWAGAAPASAALTIDSGPTVRINPTQVTLVWHTSSTSSSELRWDTAPHTAFTDYPNAESNAVTALGTVHSRTISNLTAGTYYFQVRSTGAAGTAVSGTRRFTIDQERGAAPVGSMVVGGTVNDTLVSGTRTYLAGDFNQVGPRLGSGVQVSATTGAIASGPGSPQVKGSVQSSISDGAGGWYIGGSFTHVGGLERRGVAHLLPDGGVDPYFDPGAGPDMLGLGMGTVTTIKLANGRLFIGGWFDEFDGEVRGGLAALVPATGELDTVFDPGTGITGAYVRALEVYGNRLFVAGLFSSYRGTTTSGIVAVSTITADVDTGFATGPGLSASAIGYALVRIGTTLYIGGSFTTYAGAPHNDLVAVNADTGVPVPGFTSGSGVNGAGIHALAATAAGDRIFVGGSFSTYDLAANANVLAVSPTTGMRDPAFVTGAGADSNVYSMAVVGARLVIGGMFDSYAGTLRPRLAAMSTANGAIDLGFDPGTGPNEDVIAVASNGSRLYVGGNFTGYGGTARNNIAALVTATGALDTGFNPVTGTNGEVEALAVSGTRLYLGGAFTMVNNEARNRLAALNTATGSLDTGFLPAAGPTSTVRALAVSGSRLYLGGSFSSYAGDSRPRIAAVDVASAALDLGFTPGTGFTGPLASVDALVVNGARLYVGGEFTSYNGTPRTRLASLDLASALNDNTFNPPAPDDDVETLVVGGGRLIAGGWFENVGATPRPNVAAFGLSTGSLQAGFVPSSTSDGWVNDLAVVGTTLFVGGSFSAWDASGGSKLVALDVSSAARLPGFDSAPGETVEALATDGTALAVGGSMSSWTNPNQVQGGAAIIVPQLGDSTSDGGALSIGTPSHSIEPAQVTVRWTSSGTASSELVWDNQPRTGWGAYANSESNTSTTLGTVHSRTISNLQAGTYYYRVRSRDAGGGQATSSERTFTVAPPDEVTPIGSHVLNGGVRTSRTDVAGTTLYAAGGFTRVAERAGAAVPVSTVTGARLPGMPQVNGDVTDIVPDGAGGWYVSGNFTRVGGHAIPNLAHLLPDGGVDTSFVTAGIPGVRTMLLDAGTLYVGGGFTNAAGQLRRGLAAFNATTGALLPWNPGATGTTIVYDLALAGTTLYVGGTFTMIGGQARQNIAALTLSTGVPTAWNPGASDRVLTFEQNAATLYVGGAFTTFGGQARNYLAAVTIASGAVTAWNPNISAALGRYVQALALSGTTIYVGGVFTAVGASARARLAAIDTGTGAATGWSPDANGAVNEIVVAPTNVYVGGAFTTTGGAAARRYVAEISRATGVATTLDPSPTGSVSALALSGTTLYLGGQLAGVGGTPRAGGAAFDARTGELLDWNPNVTGGEPNDIQVTAASVYIGGSFTTVGGVARANLASVHPVTGALQAWNPGANAAVQSIAVTGTTAYVGGWFSTLAGQPRTRIGAVHATTGAALAFAPALDDAVWDIELDGTNVYVAGRFTNAAGQPRNGLASFSAAGAVSTWDPQSDYESSRLLVNGSTVYVACMWCTTLGGQPRAHAGAVDKVTGVATPWNPNADSQVYDLVLDGTDILLAGVFDTVGGADHRTVARVNTTDGAVHPWNPDVGLYAETVTALPGGLFIGGHFRTANEISQHGMAVYNTCDRTSFCDDESLRDYVSISTPASVTLPTAIPEMSSVETFDVTVRSNALFGYSILASDTSDTAALTCTTPPCTGSNIPDWAGLPGAPTPWSEAGSNYGFGITVLGSDLSPKDPSWGAGMLPDDHALNRYVGLRSATPTTLHSPDRFVANTDDVTTMGLRARVDTNQQVGTYQGTITLTAIANP